MSKVSASVTVAGRIAEAEELWYDIQRWPSFVDGFSHVVEQGEAWPREGLLVWDAKPHGRGRVLERVASYEPRAGQTAEVEDEKVRGTQTLSFEAEGDSTRVRLTLDYAIKERTPLTPLVDLLFIRRAMRESLRRTLMRFALERRGDAELQGS